jgi:hypothetical protein
MLFKETGAVYCDGTRTYTLWDKMQSFYTLKQVVHIGTSEL